MSRLGRCLLVCVLIIGSSLAGNDSEIEKDKVDVVGPKDWQLNGTEVSDKEVEDKIADDQELKVKEKKHEEGKQVPPTDDTDLKQIKINDTQADDKKLKTSKPEDDLFSNLPPCRQTKGSRRNQRKKKNRRRKDKARKHETYEEDDSSENDRGDEKVEALTRYNCMNALPSARLSHMCCHSQIWDDDMNFCTANVETSDTDFISKMGERQAALKLIDCIYQKKRYLKSGERLDMDRVIADATKLNDTVRGDFMVQMHVSCEHLARESVKDYKKRRSGFKSFSSSHEVFMLVLFGCIDNYLTSNTCPYFHWRGKCSEINNKCMGYTKECKALMGH